MKNMTVDEIKAMVGTEFKYVLSSHFEIPAVVAAFDEKIGFTVLATSLIDSNDESHAENTDGNGNLCLIGIGRDRCGTESDFLEKVTLMAKVIKHLGYFAYGADHKFARPKTFGLARCSF